MSEELPLLFDRIRVLLKRGQDVPSHSDVLEHTLTDGYAHALALESERERTRRHIRALASDAESAEHARQLQELMTRLHRTEIELEELRGLLRTLAAAAR
jgi:hypothetical protein